MKARQAEIEAKPTVQAMKASRFWEHRRAQHLLTGLVRCGACGGSFAAVGRDYLACANARKLDRCEQRKGIRREVLETLVLDLVRDNLMQPHAVKAFVAAYHQRSTSGGTARPRSAPVSSASSRRQPGSSRAFTTPSPRG